MTDSSESLLLFFGVWTKQSNFSIFQKEEAEKIYAKHLRWNRFFSIFVCDLNSVPLSTRRFNTPDSLFISTSTDLEWIYIKFLYIKNCDRP